MKRIFLFLAVVIFFSGCIETPVFNGNHTSNYYNNTTNGTGSCNCTNGTNGTDGINGTNGSSLMGSTTNYYLHNTTSTGLNFTSFDMDRVFNVSSPMRFINFTSSANGVHFIGNWTTPELNVTLIPHGVHMLHFDVTKSSGSDNRLVYMYFDCMLVTRGNATISHGTSWYSNEIVAGNNEIDAELVVEDLIVNSTDRLLIRVGYVQSGVGLAPTISFRYDDMTSSRLIIPATQTDLTGLINNVTTLQSQITGKVNKSGDTITGYMFFNSTNNISFVEYTDENITRSKLYDFGVQFWNLGSSAIPDPRTESGAIGYSFAGSAPSITILRPGQFDINNQTSPTNRFPNITVDTTRFDIWPGVFGSQNATLMRTRTYTKSTNSYSTTNKSYLTDNGDFALDRLVGSGNAYACVDSTGKLYRGSPTC